MGLEPGIRGFVCSPQEVASLRALTGPEGVLVIPGIRPAGAAIGDQKRIATPADALRQGASYLVVGRPITQAPDPAEAAEAILKEMAEALWNRTEQTQKKPGWSRAFLCYQTSSQSLKVSRRSRTQSTRYRLRRECRARGPSRA